MEAALNNPDNTSRPRNVFSYKSTERSDWKRLCCLNFANVVYTDSQSSSLTKRDAILGFNITGYRGMCTLEFASFVTQNKIEFD